VVPLCFLRHRHKALSSQIVQAALRQRAALQAVIREYVKTYGEGLILHGEAEYSVEALERLAGWEG
jgi:hypothetical protein